MNPNRTRDAVLTFLGGVAVLAYVLACTSFSPDDSKVLFPAVDTKSGGLALAVYDRENGSTEHLLTFPASVVLIRAIWTADGRRVVALWSEKDKDDRLRVTVVPFRGRETVRLMNLDNVGKHDDLLVTPPARVGSRLFLGSGKKVTRLDLDTGEWQTDEAGGDIFLLGQRERVFYLRRLPGPGAPDNNSHEFGRLDPKDLTCQPLLRVPTMPGQNFSGFFAVGRDGKRLVLLGEISGQLSFLLYDGKELTRAIPAGTKDDPLEVGNFLLSPDGSTLYATYASPSGGEASPGKPGQWGILELPVDGSPGRRIPLFTVAGQLGTQDVLFFQLDLSHDGKAVAACSTYVAKGVKPEDLALYLVDLTRSDRKVKKIPIPAPPMARDAKEKEK